MKTLTHLRIMAAAVLLLLFACRQEITTIDDHNSKREQEFFRDAQEKTAKLGNGNFVIDLLKKENDKTHFVTRLKDQNGLPVWDKITLTGSSNTNKINTSDTLTVAIPLSEDKEYLSSLLIAKVANGGIIQIKNIDNTDLYRYVNDSSVPAYKRETALLNFIYADHKVFGTKYYINIPADLFPDIELRTGESKKRMNIVSISEEDISSFAVPIRICVTREDVCGHCSGTVILGYKTECFTYIGEYTDGGSGEDGGSGDTSGDTGGGGGSPGSGSSECEKGGWYRVVPPGCPNGDDLPVVVQNLKNRLLSYGEQYDIYLYEPYLASNLTVAEKFGAYLTQNNNPQAAAFVMWGLGFLSQNTSTTWAQFEQKFITGYNPQYQYNIAKLSPQESQQLIAINNEIASSPYDEEYVKETNEAFAAFGAAADFETMTDGQMQSVLSQCCPSIIVVPQALFNQKAKLITANYQFNRKFYPEWSKAKCFWEAARETIQLLLDLGGLVPVVGEVCDLTNATIYAIYGDELNASLSTLGAIPVAGWFATGSKLGVKVVNKTASHIASRQVLKWIVGTDGLIKFGYRSQLRKVLQLTDKLKHAHHIIPWEFSNYAIVQKAAKSANAFHMNDLINGIPLPTTAHLTGHAAYNSKLQQILLDLDLSNPNMSANEAYNHLQAITNQIKNLIQNNPNMNLGQISTLIKYP
ncbi:AHH domain-containing protein [Epilithonimonas vandammei]|uniref:AHH domain-containing protein n=1 Tax=Epilithonimonas vandammei TaxID=2487072 RepID=UPI00289B2E16|nr:AHH domain-containing protein [Epilithonimonas vandammei]